MMKRNQQKFSQTMLIMIISIIVVFFGGFLLLINLISNSDMTFINVFFGIFITIAVLAVVFGYLITNHSQGDELIMGSVIAPKSKVLEQGTKGSKISALICGSCGVQVKTNDKFCLECGSAL